MRSPRLTTTLAAAVLVCLLAPETDAQRGKKRGKRRARPAPVEQPAPVPDAERAAELRRLAEEAEARRRELVEADAPKHFALCDLDASGWVSYREATRTLGIDKEEFRQVDSDGDGRLSPIEFRARVMRMVELLGALHAPVPATEELARRAAAEGSTRPFEPRFNPPAAAPTTPLTEGLEPEETEPVPASPAPRKNNKPAAVAPPARPALPFPQPGQLLGMFDEDTTGGLSLEEVRLVIAEVGDDLSPELILQQTDRDDSGELEPRELAPLAYFVSERLPESMVPVTAEEDAQPPVEDAPATPTAPAVAAGPCAHFVRLDVDGSGAIDAGDLRRRLDGARATMRLQTLIAVLDTDGDGALTDAEFRTALGR